MIFHENQSLLKYHALIVIFEQQILNCLLQIIGGALWVRGQEYFDIALVLQAM